MLKKLISYSISATIALYISSFLLEDVTITDSWQTLITIGIVLGAINTFIRPILKFISFPINLITLGLFYIVINAGLIYILDIYFDSLYISSITSLGITALIVILLDNITKKIV